MNSFYYNLQLCFCFWLLTIRGVILSIQAQGFGIVGSSHAFVKVQHWTHINFQASQHHTLRRRNHQIKVSKKQKTEAQNLQTRI